MGESGRTLSVRPGGGVCGLELQTVRRGGSRGVASDERGISRTRRRKGARFKAFRQESRMAEGKIVTGAIDAASLEAQVAGTANGAVCTFIGQVRRQSKGHEVAYLEYDAYVPMA